MDLQDILEHVGAEPEAYSGRGMMGKDCLSIKGSLRNCFEFLAAAAKDVLSSAAHGAELSEAEEIIDLLFNFRTDQLGHGVVLYWPRIPFIPAVGEDDDESEFDGTDQVD